MSDARHIEELERRCRLLEQVVLIQEKRVWSQDMLKMLEQGKFMAGADAAAKASTRQLLEGNLRCSTEILDRLALELGYESRSVFKLLDPEFVYGAPGQDVGEELRRQLERVDAREREAGTSHLSALLRDLKTRHDAFLGEVQEHVQQDVELHSVFSSLVKG
ncbi:MAG: hypothetical protein AB7N76_17285 [Planctomycetota bacterium]